MSQSSTKMWSGRFREPLDPTFESWQRSFPFDWRLVPYEVEASIAHARAIEAAGILTSEELLQMEEGLRAVARQQAEQGEAIVTANPQAEDVHHYVELELTKQIGDLALKLHTGRSRNEQIATDMRLFVREAIDNTLAGLAAWRKALIDLAESAGEATMPSYTHLQRAEPVLIAHWLLAYVTMIERDASRLTDARKRMNLCPLGSGAVAGATLALDRTIAARALAFDAPTPNSMDATSDRDFALEFTQAIATLGIHISRFAEELTLYSTAEFAFLDLPERFSTGSSAMPQKKNPDLTELIRGKSGRLLRLPQRHGRRNLPHGQGHSLPQSPRAHRQRCPPRPRNPTRTPAAHPRRTPHHLPPIRRRLLPRHHPRSHPRLPRRNRRHRPPQRPHSTSRSQIPAF